MIAKRLDRQAWRYRDSLVRGTAGLSFILLAQSVWAQPPTSTEVRNEPSVMSSTGGADLRVQPTGADAPHQSKHVPGDPLEKLNRSFYKGQDKIDRKLFRPVALGYKHIVPHFLRSAIRNLLHELSMPIVFLNDVLQLKPKMAVRTLERFVINTTIGVGGIIDVAKREHLPYRKNGFGNTLGRYGVRPGPYIYLPLIGPTTLRDLFGSGVDGVIPPTVIGFPYNRLDYRLSTAAAGTLDLRAESDAELNALLGSAADPYATLRSVYLQNRAAEIDEIRGKKSAVEQFIDPLTDPASSPAPDAGSKLPPSPQDAVTNVPTSSSAPPGPATSAPTQDQGEAGKDVPPPLPPPQPKP